MRFWQVAALALRLVQVASEKMAVLLGLQAYSGMEPNWV
jgi:hypothetical protein